MLEIRLLGQFEVRQDDTVLTISSRPAQSLLAYLLLNPGIGHRREQLAGLLAPDSAEENARGVLRHALWRLRKTLGVDPLTGRDYLLVDEFTIAFDASAHYWLDAAVVAAPLTTVPSTEHLAASLAEYAGDLLPGFYDDWVVLARVRLEAIFEGKMRRLLEQQLAAGCWADAAGSGRAVDRAGPLARSGLLRADGGPRGARRPLAGGVRLSTVRRGSARRAGR